MLPGVPPPAESGAGSWPVACPGSLAEALQTHQTAKKKVDRDTVIIYYSGKLQNPGSQQKAMLSNH